MKVTFGAIKRFHLSAASYAAVFSLLIVLSNGIFADAFSNDSYRFHGFGTLSGVATDDDDYVYRHFDQHESKSTDLSFQPESLLGAQLDTEFGEKWFATVQALLSLRDKENPELSAEWAYLGYYFTPNVDVKVGKVLTPVFMQSKYRYVGYLTQTVRPSISLYPLDPLSNHDGFSLTVNNDNVMGGYLSSNFYAGKNRYRVTEFPASASSAGGEGVIKGDLAAGFAFDWTLANITLHTAYKYVDFHVAGKGFVGSMTGLKSMLVGCTTGACNTYRNRIDNIIEGSRLEYISLGGQYENDTGLVMIEYFTRKSDSIMQDARGVNLTGVLKFGSWSPYVNSGFLRTDKNAEADSALDGQPMPVPMFNRLLENGHIDRDVWALGTRWDFFKNVAAKAEVMRIHEDSAFAQADLFTPPVFELYAKPRDQWFNLYTVTIDFMF